MTDLARWLDDRRPPPPPSLQAAMREALSRSDPGEGPPSRRLAAAALDALAAVVGVPSARAEALRLLAADALLTYACEAALAEPVVDGVDPVDRFLDTLDMERFARILHEEVAE